MKQKRLITSTLLVMLCLATAIAAFVNNTTGQSHAAETKTQTSTLTQHSHAIVNGNVYYGTDSHSAYALNATTGKLIWQYTATSPVNALSLSLNADRVYFATTNTAYALNAANGTLLWRFQSQTFVALWSPAIVNGSMYLSDDYGVTALNASTGAVRWRFSSSAFVTPGIVEGGTVYFVAGDNAAHAVNAASGASLWSYSIGNSGNIQAISNRTVYIITDRIYPHKDSLVYALHADDGSLLWHYDMRYTRTGNDGSYLSVVNGVVYTIADLGHGGFSLTALDAASGAVLWPHNTTYYVYSFQVVNGVLYLSNFTSVYGLNASSGKLLWQYQPGSSDQPGTIVVVNDVVYVATASNGPTIALNATNGAVLWSYQPKDPGGDILVANGLVYTGGNYHLYALNGSTGSLVWSHYIAHSLISISMVVNGTLYVYSSTTVDAFNASNGAELWHYPY